MAHSRSGSLRALKSVPNQPHQQSVGGQQQHKDTIERYSQRRVMAKRLINLAFEIGMRDSRMACCAKIPHTMNTLWVAANIIFDLETGKTTQVLMLVNRKDDATEFNEKDAGLYKAFVQRRAKHLEWSIEPTKRPDMFVIKGLQNG